MKRAIPKLTIGLPTFDDYDGCWFTLQALRLYHDLREVELLVVDNKPDSPGSATLKTQIEKSLSGGTAAARYVAAGDAMGPAATKNRVFAEAAGEAVLCLDSHVLLQPGAVAGLLAWYEEHPDSRDLVQGPLLYDNLSSIATHFDDVWRGQMWGVWASMPERLGWDDADAFDIPGQGMGLFSCRREAWPEFNAAFRGFGGEEMYIHEKFRQRGDRALCLGFLKWLHRFGRPAGVKYPLRLWDKVRNYVIGLQELGLPLEPAHEHFVGGKFMSQADWDFSVSDPLGHVEPPGRAVAITNAAPTAVAVPESIEGIYDQLAATSGYLDKHLPKIRALAAECQTVEEVSRYRETTVALLAGKPAALRSHLFGPGAATNPLYDRLAALAQAEGVAFTREESLAFRDFEVADCDLLFYKTEHQHPRLFDDLVRWSPRVRRYIAIHDTAVNGPKLADGSPGFSDAMRRFVDEQPGWFVAYHTPEQFGLTVLGRLAADRPAKQIHAWLPGSGPGSELKAILASLGIQPSASCDCNGKAAQMDLWGVDECRARRDTIVGWMREGFERWGWKEALSAAAKALASGLAFKLNPLDPFPSLIDEAIRRAEAKE